MPEFMEYSKSGSKMEVYSNTGLSQKTRKISNKQSNNAPKGIGKRRTNQAQNQQKKGNNKNQSRNK